MATIDNIHPDTLYSQLKALQRSFAFLPLDDLLVEKKRPGLAAVTFDDGYKTVISNALPVLEALDVPATLFVNPSTLDNTVFWRHKLLHLIEAGLAGEIARYLNTPDILRAAKSPQYRTDDLVPRIDAVLRSNGVHLENHLFDDGSYFVDHPLLSYGNHTYSHYVLASLDRAAQRAEIKKARDVLSGFGRVRKSNVLSLPFGEAHHLNVDTIAVAKEMGYKALLLNRGGLNLGWFQQHKGITLIERFSPGEEPIKWQITRECLAAIKGRLPKQRPLAMGRH